MSLTNTAQHLHDSMSAILDTWGRKQGGASHPLYWLLRAQDADVKGEDVGAVLSSIEDPVVRADVTKLWTLSAEYWADVRYASLEPVTKLWGTIVNSLRVAAETGRANERQRDVFDFKASSVLAFFRAAWDRMEIADGLYHVFRAMPAPECQAMAALLNVHVDALLDETVMCRVARLLDHEGPMSAEENSDLASLSNTDLVHATFSGLRRNA
jgi:hypothetical protein